MINVAIRWTIILASVIAFLYSARAAVSQQPTHRFKGNKGFSTVRDVDHGKSPAANKDAKSKDYYRSRNVEKNDSFFDKTYRVPSKNKSNRRFNGRVFVNPRLVEELRARQLAASATAQQKAPLFGSPEFGPSPGYGFGRPARPKPAPPAVVKRPVVPKKVTSPFASFSSIVPTSHAANVHQVQAEEEFFRGNYQVAASHTDQVLLIDNTNGSARMFASLAHVAAGDYDKAGRLFREGAKKLDSAQWYRVFASSNNFYGSSDYASHMKLLSEYCESNPFKIDAIRLRGFHTLMIGDTATAQKDFQTVLSSIPKDTVTQKLFAVLEKQSPVFGDKTPAKTSSFGNDRQIIPNQYIDRN